MNTTRKDSVTSVASRIWFEHRIARLGCIQAAIRSGKWDGDWHLYVLDEDDHDHIARQVCQALGRVPTANEWVVANLPHYAKRYA